MVAFDSQIQIQLATVNDSDLHHICTDEFSVLSLQLFAAHLLQDELMIGRRRFNHLAPPPPPFYTYSKCVSSELTKRLTTTWQRQLEL